MAPRTPPNGPTPGFELEKQARRWGLEGEQRITDAIAEARLCRQQYDAQMAEHGEIGRELHIDLAIAAVRLYDELIIFSDDVDGFPDMDEIKDEAYATDIVDNPDLPAKLFAGYIDALEAAALKLGFVEVQNE